MHNLHQLTGIRGLAAFIVVFYHIESYLRPYSNDLFMSFIQRGYLAVDFFFILSGFVIAFNYFDRLEVLTRQKIAQFYLKRVARIYPLHLLMLLAYLSIPLAYWVTGKPLGEEDRFSQEAFVLSFFLMQAWGGLEHLTWNIPSWSISTEMMAYLLFPLMVFLLKSVSKKSPVLIGYVALLVASLAIVCIFHGTENIGTNIQQLGVYRCALEFFCGVCIWFIYQNSSDLIYGKTLFYSALLLFFSLIALGVTDYYFVSLTMSGIILGSVNCQNRINEFFSHKLLIWLGNISYSIYLTHYFIRDCFKLFFLETSGASVIWIVSYVVTVLIVSHFLYKYYELTAKNKILTYFYKKN